MQQCKYAKCAKSAKCSSSDIQRGRCPPQPTQTTASTSSPKPLMSSEWPSVAASQGSQPACSWKKKNLTQLFRDGVTSLTPESRDIFSLHTAQTGTKVQEKWKKIKWVDLQTSQFHSSYLSLPPLPLTVYFFQASVLFAQRAPNFGHFVTNLHTFWCTYTFF